MTHIINNDYTLYLDIVDKKSYNHHIVSHNDIEYHIMKLCMCQLIINLLNYDWRID